MEDREILRKLAEILNVHMDEVPKRLEKLKQETEEMERKIFS